MGVSTIKQMEGAKIVRVDLAAPAYIMRQMDKENLKDPEGRASVEFGASRFLINQAIGSKWPAGVDRKDGKIWAAWLELLDAEEKVLEIPYSLVEWLRDILGANDLKLVPGLCQWREELVTYLEGIKPEAEAQSKE